MAERKDGTKRVRGDQAPRYQHASAELTPAEVAVTELLLLGHNNESIGYQLDITLNTVKAHLYWAFRKMGYLNRVEYIVAELNRRHAAEIAQLKRDLKHFEFQSH